MTQERLVALPNISTPSQPVLFDPEVCNGCNNCVEVCQVDVFIPNPEKRKTPLILHPEECWYCGTCAVDCPCPGAIQFNWPLQARGYWKNKKTGKISQL